MEFDFFISLIIYIGTIVFLMIFLCLYKKNKKTTFIIIGVIPIILMATFRVNVGTDFQTYKNIYEGYKNVSIWNVNSATFEVGYYLINKIGQLFNSFKIVLFISSTITIMIPIYTFRDVEGISLPLFALFYYVLVFIPSLNLIRQGIAISITFYSMYNLGFKNNKKAFVVWTLIASFFHISALFMLPIIFIINKKGKLNIFYSMFLVFIITILVFNFSWFLMVLENFPIVSKYIRYDFIKEGNNREFYFYLTLLAGFMIFKNKFPRINNVVNIMLLLLAIKVIVLYLGFEMVYVKRISLYFELAPILLLSSLHTLFDIREWKIIKTAVFILGIALFIVLYTIIGHSDIFPYQI